jgi:cytochrome c556
VRVLASGDAETVATTIRFRFERPRETADGVIRFGRRVARRGWNHDRRTLWIADEADWSLKRIVRRSARRKSMKRVSWGFLALGCALASAAYAATPAEYISARQQSYKQIGKAFKATSDELKKSDPSIDVLRTNSATLDRLSHQVHRWFPKGSGPEAGVKTAALPGIWQQWDQFRMRANNFAGQARGLNLAAAKGDMARVRAYASGVGGACKACHDTFRARGS